MQSAVRSALTRVVLPFFAFALVLGSTTFLAAQNTASITGVVTDQTGAVIPAVSVTLENPQTGAAYKTVTNTAGSYTLNEVKPGPGYKIEFTHDGFKETVLSGLYMNVDATRVQNAQLVAGAVSITLEVSASNETVTLDKTDSTVGNNFQVQFMNDLPVNLRGTPSALFTQQPGVTLDGATTGAREDQNRVTVDGLDVNDYATGQFGSIVGNAPVDSVQEFRGVSGGFLSDAGGGGGGQFELVTRSGTNTFHGSVSEYYRDRSTEANDWFNNNTGVPRPPLIRNQFGASIGGPVIKNKLFFFFNYYGRRDTLSALEDRTVPLDSFRAGTLQYINTSNNIATADITGLDPQHVGFSSSLLSLFSSRYPHANDFTGAVGDGINTAGFRFNAPFPRTDNVYVQRIDYNLNDKMKLFGRGTVTRTNSTESAVRFPGDPETSPFFDKSYAWVVGHTWTISNTKVNQASYGEVYEDFSFPNTYNPEGINQFQTFGGNGSGGAILTSPYASAINAQARTYPIPVIRDDFSWDKGKHAFKFGGTFKYISPNGVTILNYNTPVLGLGGYMSALDSNLRPTDICPPSATTCNPAATTLYDGAFALAVAPYTQVGATFNYDSKGNVLPQGTGSLRDYRYYETELYFGDTWKTTPELTLSYGLRWIYYTVPYERNGLESVQSTDFKDYFSARQAQSAASQSGNLAVPLISYSLGGKANNAPGYYSPQKDLFGPRIALAYSPEILHGKTVFNVGAGITYDQTIINAVQYQQTQYSYLFQASTTNNGPGSAFASNPTVCNSSALPETLLASCYPRFSGLSSPPGPAPAPPITKPFFPFVTGSGSSAVPFGLANLGAFNETIDTQLKNPYYISYSLGFQHEFPQGYILRATWVNRLGRRLLAQADANQLIDFPDPASGQLMSQAFASITQQLRAGVNPLNVTAQPWYEDILPPGLGVALGFSSNTALVAGGAFFPTYVQRGDFGDMTAFLAAFGLLPPNVGMAAQFSENTFYTNKGSSSYNGMLLTLHKNLGYGLQFDLNYTWSHSIDNVSVIANAPAIGGYGFICDVLRPGECRSNSDFDVTNYLNGNFIYELPFGRGKKFGAGASRWLDEIIGGWEVSGLPNWHSGLPWFAYSNAFVAGYANDAPAILVGVKSDVHTHLNGGHGQALNIFANPTNALTDFTGPVGFNIGSRNNLRGPGFFDLDLGLGKAIPLGTERVSLKVRVDAFNVLNHPNFDVPAGPGGGADITQAEGVPFGVITSTVGNGINSTTGINTGNTSRVLQGSLRVEF